MLHHATVLLNVDFANCFWQFWSLNKDKSQPTKIMSHCVARMDEINVTLNFIYLARIDSKQKIWKHNTFFYMQCVDGFMCSYRLTNTSTRSRRRHGRWCRHATIKKLDSIITRTREGSPPLGFGLRFFSGGPCFGFPDPLGVYYRRSGLRYIGGTELSGCPQVPSPCWQS